MKPAVPESDTAHDTDCGAADLPADGFRDGEARYRSLFQSMRQGVVYARADGSVIDANPAALALLGLDWDELQGRNCFDAAWDVVDESGASLPADQHPPAVALRTGRPVLDAMAGVRNARTGERLWLLVDAIPQFRDGDPRPCQVFVTLHDLTERRWAEEQLRLQSLVLDQIQDGVTVTDLEGRITYVNAAQHRIHQRTREELIGALVSVFAGRPEAEDGNLQIAAATLREGQWCGEVHNRTGDGRDIVLDLRTHLLHDSRGSAVGMFGLNTDITERKRAEEALRASEQRFRQIVETAEEGVWQVDAQWHTTYVNRRMEEMLGYNPGAMLGRHISEFMDEEGRRDAAARMMRREQGQRETHDFRFLRADGLELHALVSAAPLMDERGTHTGGIAMVTDISARRAAEQALRDSEAKYRAAVETSADGFWIADREGRLLEVNDAYCRRSGYSRDELLGMSIADLEGYESVEQIRAHMDRVVNRGSDLFDTLHRTRDGTLWQVEVNTSFWPVDGGSFFTFVRDVMRRSRADALLRTRAQLADISTKMGLEGLLQAAVDAAELHTGSRVAFLHFVDADQETLTLQVWSTNTLQRICITESPDKHRAVSAAGVWADCIRGRRPVIHNDYATLEHWRGLPEGHAPVVRELVVPILRADRMVAVLGVGNKTGDYTQEDVELAQQLASMVMDLVERKRAEDALRFNEEKLRSIFRAAPIGIGVVSERVFTEVNATLCEMLGYSREELVGKSARPLYLTQEEYEWVGREKYGQMAEHGNGTVETQWRRRDGTVIDVLLSSTPVDRADLSRGVTFTALDITQRKQREAELRRLTRIERAVGRSGSALLHAADENAYLNEVCRIVVEDCGHAMVWVGYAEHDAARSIRPVAHAGFEDGYLQTLNLTWADTERGRGPGGRAIRNGRPAFARPLAGDPSFAPWRAEALKRGYTAVGAFPLLDEHGKAFGALGIYSAHEDAFSEAEVKLTALADDLAFGVRTLRLRAAHAAAEHAMEGLRGELQRLVEQQVASQTAAGIAHELNQPLNAVAAYGQAAVQLLGKVDGASPQLTAAVEGMVAGARQAGAVVRQLLAFFDRGEGASEQLDLESLAREAVSLTRSSGFRGVGVSVRAEAGLPPVRVDRLQIEKVFLNLLRNAIEAQGETATAGRTPSLLVRLADNGDGMARVSVIDRGPGIRAEIAPRIFDPFFTSKKGGIGMGLQISRALVEAHGGRLWYEPTPGGGATFHFTLPYAT